MVKCEILVVTLKSLFSRLTEENIILKNRLDAIIKWQNLIKNKQWEG